MSHYSNASLDSTRKSSRKRRSPGEWWREFDTEKKRATMPTSSPTSVPGNALAGNENILSMVRESDRSKAVHKERLNNTLASDEKRGVHGQMLSRDLAPPGSTSALTDTEKGADTTPVLDISFAVRGSREENLSNRAGQARFSEEEEEEDAIESHKEEEVTPVALSSGKTRQDRNILYSPSLPAQGTLVHAKKGTRPSPQAKIDSGTSPKSAGKEVGGSLLSSQGDIQNAPQGLISQPYELFSCAPNIDPARNDGDLGMKQRKEKGRMRRADMTPEDHPTSIQMPRTQTGLQQPASQNLFSSAQRFASADVLRSDYRDKSPTVVRKLNTRAVTEGASQSRKDISMVNAPRKRRLETSAPNYSFSLRSRFESESFSEPVTKAGDYLKAAPDEQILASAQQEVLVAKRAALQHRLVRSPLGAVKVAISISLNQSTVGEIVIMPRSSTGPRRALSGDEFYIVKQGHGECSVGFTSFPLSAGDHFGIPEGQCFEIMNPSPSRCELFFFSPKNSKHYSLAH